MSRSAPRSVGGASCRFLCVTGDMAGSERIGFWTLANVLTLSRIPFGIGFWFVIDRPTWALAVMIVGGATDLVDGAVARRRGQAGRNGVGAWLDPVCDNSSCCRWWPRCSLVGGRTLDSRRHRSSRGRGGPAGPGLPTGARRATAPFLRFPRGPPGQAGDPGPVRALTAMLFGSGILPWIAALAGIVGLAAAGDYVRRALRAAAPRDPGRRPSDDRD